MAKFNPDDYTPSMEMLLVKVEESRKRNKMEKEKSIFPPSNFYVIKDGRNMYKKGTEVILRGTAMLTHIKEQKEYYFVDERDVAGYNEKVCE